MASDDPPIVVKRAWSFSGDAFAESRFAAPLAGVAPGLNKEGRFFFPFPCGVSRSRTRATAALVRKLTSTARSMGELF